MPAHPVGNSRVGKTTTTNERRHLSGPSRRGPRTRPWPKPMAASCTLAIVSGTGKRLRNFPVETSGQALIEAISAIAGHRHVIMEEGTQSAWLYETGSFDVVALLRAEVFIETLLDL